MTEGVIPVCDLAVSTGANIPQPHITIATDGANGPYIRQLRVGDLAFNFADTQIFRAGLWDGAGTYYLMDGEQWNPTIETDAYTGVITLTQEMGEIDVTMTGISFVCRMTPIAEGYQVSTIAMNNDNATYAVEWFEFPRLGCKSQTGDPGNLYLAHGFIGGMVLKDPHNVTLDDVLRNTLSSPPNMQYLSYWDVTTKEHLYLTTDDDDGAPKNYIITGNGSFSTLAFMHWFPNPRVVGNTGVVPYTMTYNVNMELFKGRTEDGRCGFYDAAIRYRTWGTDMTRPWMIEAEGPWMDADDVSDRVKDSDFYYVSGHSNSSAPANFWTDIVEDMSRVQTIIGSTDQLGLLYGWAENIAFLSDLEPPAFTPLIQGADQNTALGVAAGLSMHLSYYTLPPFWESSLTGDAPFDYLNFVGTIDYDDIFQYTIRDSDDTPIDPTDPIDPDPDPGLPWQPGVPVIPNGVP